MDIPSRSETTAGLRKCAGLLELRSHLSDHDLEEKLVQYVAYHFSQFQKTEEFIMFTPENLRNLLGRNDCWVEIAKG